MLTSTISMLFSFIAIATVLFCAWSGRQEYAWAANIVVFGYILFAFFAWRRGSRDASTLSWFADQVYFLGYLCTITAFVGVVLQIWKDEKMLESPQSILMLSGVALSTTMIGLIGMNVLRGYARTLEQQNEDGVSLDQMTHQLAEVVKKLITTLETSELLPAVNTLVSALREGSDNIERFRDISVEARQTIEQLIHKLRELSESTNTFNRTVAVGNPRAEVFVNNIKQVQQVLDDFVRLVKQKLNE